MPKTKKLENKISKKLEKLERLLNRIDEARLLNYDDPETWDSDTLYNLVANLKETLRLLADKEDPQKRNEFGEPIILEEGLCTLVDEYHLEEEDSKDF